MSPPDSITVIRRNPDGTESTTRIEGCTLVPAGRRVFAAIPEHDMQRIAPEVQQTQQEIAAAFDVPPAMVGLPERSESDIIAAIDQLERDEIDDLVDLQLRQTRSGFDFNINQPTCIHCGGDRHTLPIKERMQEIRRLWHSTIQYFEDGERVSEEAAAALDAYRYDEDDSEIVCWGSEFVGPPKPPVWKLRAVLEARQREATITAYLSGDPSYEQLRSAVESGRFVGPLETLGCFYAGLPLPDPVQDDSPWTMERFGPYGRPGWREVRTATNVAWQQLSQAVAAVSAIVQLWAAPLEEVEFPHGWQQLSTVDASGIEFRTEARGMTISGSFVDEAPSLRSGTLIFHEVPAPVLDSAFRNVAHLDESHWDAQPESRPPRRERRGQRERQEPMWVDSFHRGGRRA